MPDPWRVERRRWSGFSLLNRMTTMALTNGSNQDRMEQRRTHVARLRLHGLTVREIAQSLAEDGFVNPQTGEAYTHPTIVNDLKAMRAAWRQAHMSDTDDQIASLLAEVREVRRQAWANGDLATVLRALKDERDLLGLDAPKRVDIRHEINEKARQFAIEWGLDEAEVLAEAEMILRAG